MFFHENLSLSNNECIYPFPSHPFPRSWGTRNKVCFVLVTLFFAVNCRCSQNPMKYGYDMKSILQNIRRRGKTPSVMSLGL